MHRDSLVVLAGFLFAVAGGLIALALSGEAFGISAAIGFVSLLGISVMNGIILITFFNEIRATGSGMLVGPILLLLVVPALQALFLGGGEPTENPAQKTETV